MSGVSLSSLTTMRVGGPARALVTPASAEDLVAAVSRLDAAGEPVFIIGGGSNLLVGDDGVDATVVKVTHADVAVEPLTDGGVRMTAGAGADWDAIVADSVARGLGGLECLSGIPGSVGATPVQNVGAYGVEVADVLDGVELFDRTDGTRTWVAPAALGLGYRTSALKHRDERIVLSVAFRLTDDGVSAPVRYRELATALGVAMGDRAPVADVRAAVLALRAGKGMVLDADDPDTWSSGSFFTNPVVTEDALPAIEAAVRARTGSTDMPRFPAEGGVKLSAGWLIERAGFTRGFPDAQAPARLSTKHTLALTNRGTATSQDIVALARRVRDGVYDAFGVSLHPEPVLVGCSLDI
ncbi:UDP-N-acetylmuramate dehydrogenase [Williamsia deligens]|uniref:UDP-N-acetylenolpyruvoylglucosamine reductase n=1 Tax=Williamsia deligens TaxID=321325 RepID=A0ABW3G607_9NOCA|nr:UDP-N-acetylmuramate dehydrogenase [Williamsia deligens]MCP2193090.1 UDP-N-acetylmuramate dehydrogenase [Williamsia deligens]